MPLTKVTQFKYLKSLVTLYCETLPDARAHVNVEWMKWLEVTGVLCNKRIQIYPLKVDDVSSGILWVRSWTRCKSLVSDGTLNSSTIRPGWQHTTRKTKKKILDGPNQRQYEGCESHTERRSGLEKEEKSVQNSGPCIEQDMNG